MTRLKELISIAGLLAFLPATAVAQSAVDEATAPKFVFGPIGLTPRLALKDIGIDTNPLNQPGAQESDFTATVAPAVDSTLRLGRGRLRSKTSLEYVHFNRYGSQRSANLNQEARADLFLNRITPYVTGAYLRTRQRPNAEIDARVQQNMVAGGIGTAVKVGARLRFDLEARRTRLHFGEGKHGVQAIADALDREANAGSLTTKVILTPLTTFVVKTDVQHDRFRLATVRNSNSFSVVPGFELKPDALISGKITVGYRRFNAMDTSVPDFSGVVGHIEASYLWREATLFSLTADRNIDYSIDSAHPYFVTNMGLLSVTQVIGINWYALGRLGESRLNYQEFATTLTNSRVDRVLTRGFGVGRRLGSEIRIGVDLDYVRRRSTYAIGEYQGYRVGGSISYGS